MRINSMRRLVPITLATLTIANTAASAQLVYAPVEVPMPPQVDPINFGLDAAVGDGSIFVGGAGVFAPGPTTPSAVYQFDLDTLGYIGALVGTADNPDTDFFGYSVQYANDKLWVGAPLTIDGDDQYGTAYVYDPTTGSLLNRFDESSSIINQFGLFGWDLSITSSAILVGAPGFNFDGKVFIYDPVTFSLLTTLEPDPKTGDYWFGRQVAHNDQYIVVSAPSEQTSLNGGAVYVYDFASRALLYRLTSPIIEITGAEFGFNIALQDDHLLVTWGFVPHPDLRGTVALFDLVTGDLVTLLDADPTTNQDGFGNSISIEGSTAVIGAPNTNDPTIPGPDGEERGAVYLYDLNTTEMIEKIMLPATMTDRRYFGAFTKIQDGTILASSFLISERFERRMNIIKEFCRPDLNLDGSIDFFDISIFVMEMIDWDLNGVFDFFDVSKYLQAFDEGCP